MKTKLFSLFFVLCHAFGWLSAGAAERLPSSEKIPGLELLSDSTITKLACLSAFSGTHAP